MDLNLKRKKIRLTYEDMKCDVCIPTTAQVKELDENMKKKGASEMDVLYTFLRELGMSDEILDSLDIMSLREVIDTIAGKKNLKQT